MKHILTKQNMRIKQADLLGKHIL